MTTEHRPSGQVPRIGQPVGEAHHLTDYLRILYKRRWVAIPVFLVVFVVSAVNAVRQVPVYESHAQILIDTSTPAAPKIDQMFASSDYTSDDFYQTQYQILQSRSLAKATIDAMHLWNGPLGDGPVPGASFSLTGLVWGTVGGVVHLAKAPFASSAPPPAAASSTERETIAQSARIDQFLSGLDIVPVKNSRIVQVRYASTDPAFAAAAANAVSKTYIQQLQEYKFSTSKEATDWLSDRLAEQRKALEDSEAALQTYKEKNGAVTPADSASSIVVQRLTDLNAALTKAKTERIDKEATYNQIKDAQGSGSLETFPAVVANDYIQKLRSDLSDLQQQQAVMAQRYGDKNPEMIKMRSEIQTAQAKLQNELQKVVESVKNDYEAALSKEQSLQVMLDQQKTDALSQNRKDIEYGVLQRDVDSNRQIYQSLLDRTKETGISSELRASNVRIMDPAEVPRSPVSPNIQRDLTVAFGGSLMLAIGLVAGIEYLDNRIKTPEQIRQDLGLPFLGMVPALHGKNAVSGSPLMHNGVPVNFSEAVRSIRTSLLFSSAEEGAKSLVVTSAAPGEGKTLVASNIAVALAQAGQRVVLIDGDMRRPTAHELFGIAQEPGLSNLIVGKVQPSGVLRASGVPGLNVLPAGHIPPNPSELLGSRRFEELVAAFKQEFDWVVIDTPPVMAVTDACLVAHNATGVLFVIGSEMTDRRTATIALDQLEAANAHFVGAVLNRVNVDRHAYYYSHYYRRDYVKHYTDSSGS